jgi:glycosyltransferase involved in cell wall biosynthesis
MRIALVAPFGLRAKGTGRARALPLGKALVRRGHQVALFVPPYDGPEDSGLHWLDAGVEVINVRLPGALILSSPAPSSAASVGLFPKPALPRLFAAVAPWWQLVLAWRLLHAVRAWRPEVVHVFKPKGPAGLTGVALWMLRDRLVIDADDWEGPGGWNDDPRTGYSALQRRFFAWQEGYGLSHARAWTAASDCLRRRAIDFGAAPERVFLLPNGVSERQLPPLTPGPDSAGPEAARVLLYTRFAGVRVADVAAIWRRVTAVLPDARLAVVGRGLAGEENELAHLVPNVDVAGWVEPSEMPVLFASMRVALVPWADTLPNRARNSAKVLELMSAGLPIVAYAVGQLPLTLGDSAAVVPPGDEEAFAGAVVDLLNAPERAVQLGADARRRVLAEYTWDKLAEIALCAYERTIT